MDQAMNKLLGKFLIVALILLGANNIRAADRWVDGNNGNNGNAGTFSSRWRTVTFALSQLEPGDTLTIANGNYNLRNEGAGNGIARVRRPSGGRVDGWTDRWTNIRAETRGQVFIQGNIDIEGSFIRFQDLRIFGDENNDAPVLFFRDAHHIDVLRNELAFGGGGGVSFNHSDMIRVHENTTHNNGHRNSDQHSGISVYQPIAFDNPPEFRFWRIEILRNVSHDNRNIIPNPNTGITDGNGIILDDYKYTQPQFLGDRNGNTPQYQFRTLVEGNICNYNGGSGIQVFEAVRVTVKNNTCIGNRQFTFTPGGQYTNAGQVSIQNSDFNHVLNNVLVSRFVSFAPGNSPYAASESNGIGNFWQNNLVWSSVNLNALWNNNSVSNGIIVTDPNFVDEGNFDYTSRAGFNRGVRWSGHVYIDGNGVVVGSNQRNDLGALQN